MDKYFSHCYPYLGLNRDAFLQMGIHPDEPLAGFNMTAFSLKLSSYHNGVSKKHGEVARSMWRALWPDKKEEEVPIDAITNGIHVPTWVEPKIELLFNKYLGPTGWKTMIILSYGSLSMTYRIRSYGRSITGLKSNLSILSGNRRGNGGYKTG